MELAKAPKRKLYVHPFRKEKFIDRIFVSNSNICSKFINKSKYWKTHLYPQIDSLIIKNDIQQKRFVLPL